VRHHSPDCPAPRNPRLSGAVGVSESKSLASKGISDMNSIIYLVGLVVVVLFILSLLGLR
jgi:hypothetical protein